MLELVIRCADTGHTLQLIEMIQFQGDLKKRTNADLDALYYSICKDGLLMPFIIWKHDDKNMILDGHGRYAALCAHAAQHPELLQMQFPVLFIEADNEDEARKALLQIVSVYGKIDKKGLVAFATPVVNYTAPILTKIQPKPIKLKKNDKQVIRLSVAKDKVEALIDILKQVDGVKVL